MFTFKSGTLNFIPKFHVEQLSEVLERVELMIEEDKISFDIQKLPSIRAEINQINSKKISINAVNEFMLKIKDNYSLIFKIYIDDELIASPNCDAVMISS